MKELTLAQLSKGEIKMAFKEVMDLECETTTALGGTNKTTGKANPTKVEGYYIGSKDVASRKSKNGVAKLHIFKTAKGNLGVWGKTDLDRKMVNAVQGAMTRVTQNGSVPTPNGDMYKFRVEVDAENIIEVSLPSNTQPTAEEVSYDNTSEDIYESSVEDEEETFDEVVPTRASAPKKPLSTPDAERRAKVQALLNGRK